MLPTSAEVDTWTQRNRETKEYMEKRSGEGNKWKQQASNTVGTRWTQQPKLELREWSVACACRVQQCVIPLPHVAGPT